MFKHAIPIWSDKIQIKINQMRRPRRGMRIMTRTARRLIDVIAVPAKTCIGHYTRTGMTLIA